MTLRPKPIHPLFYGVDSHWVSLHSALSLSLSPSLLSVSLSERMKGLSYRSAHFIMYKVLQPKQSQPSRHVAWSAESS